MLKRRKTILAVCAVLFSGMTSAGVQTGASSTRDDVIQTDKSSSPAMRTSSRTIRVRVFIDDAEQKLGWSRTLDIRSGAKNIELRWIDSDRAALGDITGPCSFRFKRGDQKAQFDLGDLVTYGGELLIAFITKPNRLNRPVSLVHGEASLIEKFEIYDDVRSRVSLRWQKLKNKEKRRIRRAVFYSFVPDTDADPPVVSGYYFDSKL